jgi:hypothetical protein
MEQVIYWPNFVARIRMKQNRIEQSIEDDNDSCSEPFIRLQEIPEGDSNSVAPNLKKKNFDFM